MDLRHLGLMSRVVPEVAIARVHQVILILGDHLISTFQTIDPSFGTHESVVHGCLSLTL
jgi:hypothetical protein